MGDDSRFIDDIGDAAGVTGISRAIRFAQDALRVAEQGKLKTRLVGKGFIDFDAVVTRTQNLHVVAGKGVVMVTEPVPFPSSTAGVGFGVKPQHDFLAAQR